MAQAPLTPQQMNLIAQTATIAMVPRFQAASNPDYAVRVAWQEQGQPWQKITEDVAYLRCATVDDQYNRVKDVSYSQQTSGSTTIYTKTTNYTRVWEIFWSVYGPNCFDNARLLRTRLFDQDIHDLFSAAMLYFVTDPAEPQYIPYEDNGQWWLRTDFRARFNEFVTEEYVTNSVLSVEISVETALGVEVADFTVEA